jgi:hypothetical protein
MYHRSESAVAEDEGGGGEDGLEGPCVRRGERRPKRKAPRRGDSVFVVITSNHEGVKERTAQRAEWDDDDKQDESAG